MKRALVTRGAAFPLLWECPWQSRPVQGMRLSLLLRGDDSLYVMTV